MSELIDLKQDIDSLNREILSIEKHLKSIKDELEKERKGFVLSQATTDAIIEDGIELNSKYGYWWADHPEMKSYLFNHSNGWDITKNNSDSTTRIKTLRNDILRHDRELKMEPDFEQRMFDPSIASFFDVDILRSLSKRNKLIPPTAAEQSTAALVDFVELENCYRMSGITFFPLVSPGKLHALKDTTKTEEMADELLGIRMEVFNELQRCYEPPYYILLMRNPKANDNWLLFKHTIPRVIDTEHIWSSTHHGIISTDMQIHNFARRCYVGLLDLHYRVNFVSNLDPELFRDITIDSYAVSLSFKVTNNTEALSVTIQMQEKSIINCNIDSKIHDEWSNVLLGDIDDLPDKVRTLQASI
ncbi:HCL415Wp [Eremothecium sinecaudum]|uniref:HCL415Wp n=1 Tax=Eremothecium sinecaudum TaxID=45286 RepID=A0A109UY82_9SACH|nr:HCL415Wp [Eremothecium sinecaudum]AMD19736.1 HCL415Wp [Eremothecium sinecaudum]